MPNPLTQFPTSTEAARVARGKQLFTTKVSAGGAGCADCHHNGNRITNGELDDTFQDFNIHEPGVVSETTVDGNGPFLRLASDYFFVPFGAPQDEGSRQNVSSRNTKHLRSFWDSAPRWLHHGDAHSVRAGPAGARLTAARAERARLQFPDGALRSSSARRVDRLPRWSGHRPADRGPDHLRQQRRRHRRRRHGADLRQPRQPVRDGARRQPRDRPARHQQRRSAHRRQRRTATDQPHAGRESHRRRSRIRTARRHTCRRRTSTHSRHTCSRSSRRAADRSASTGRSRGGLAVDPGSPPRRVTSCACGCARSSRAPLRPPP